MAEVTQPTISEICPACDGTLRRVDVPNHNLYTCEKCSELWQLNKSGDPVRLNELLVRTEMGDDRARAAVSTPHVTSVKSFLEVFDGAHRSLELNLAEARGGLRTVLAQAENRLDFALGELTGLAMASDQLAGVVAAIAEVREMLSPLRGQFRGIAPKETNASATSTSE